MEPSLRREARRLCALARRAALLGELSRQIAVALVVVGCLVLLLRLLIDVPRFAALWCLLLLAPALITAFLSARRRFLSERAAVAWLDIRSGRSGALVTEWEQSDARWQGRVADCLRRPAGRPRLHWRRILRPLVPALLFAGAAFWVDVARGELHQTPVEFLESALSSVQEKLSTLEETVELEEELAEELQARMQRLREEADPDQPESTFEALERLDEHLQEEAEQVRESAQEMEADLSRLDALARDDPGNAEQLQSTLEEVLRQLDESGLGGDLPESLSDLLGGELPEGAALDLSGLPLSDAQLAELSSDLRDMLDAKMGELLAAGLLDGEWSDAELQLAELSEFQFFEECEECKKGEPGG